MRKKCGNQNLDEVLIIHNRTHIPLSTPPSSGSLRSASSMQNFEDNYITIFAR